MVSIPSDQVVDIRYVDLTLMLVGSSGLGKTSLISSFFSVDLDNADVIVPTTTKIKFREWIMDTEARDIKLRLNVFDTPGYGDDPDVYRSFSVVLNHIDFLNKQYQSNKDKDQRVNIVLYFLPTPRIKECDLIFLRSLSKLALVMPIISKADTLRAVPEKKSELSDYKSLVEDQLKNLTDQRVYAVVNARKGKPRNYGWGCVDPWGEHAKYFDNIALSDHISKNFREIRKQVEAKYIAWQKDSIPSFQVWSSQVQFLLAVIVVLVVVLFGVAIKSR